MILWWFLPSYINVRWVSWQMVVASPIVYFSNGMRWLWKKSQLFECWNYWNCLRFYCRSVALMQKMPQKRPKKAENDHLVVSIDFSWLFTNFSIFWRDVMAIRQLKFWTMQNQSVVSLDIKWLKNLLPVLLRGQDCGRHHLCHVLCFGHRPVLIHLQVFSHAFAPRATGLCFESWQSTDRLLYANYRGKTYYIYNIMHIPFAFGTQKWILNINHLITRMIFL